MQRAASIPLNTGRTLGRHVSLGPGWDFNRPPSPSRLPAQQEVQEVVTFSIGHTHPGLVLSTTTYTVATVAALAGQWGALGAVLQWGMSCDSEESACGSAQAL